MTNKTLLLPIGNIGTGKTTLGQELVDEYGFRVISRDNLRRMINGDRYRFGFDEDLVKLIEETALSVALWSEKDVYVDETHVNRENRVKKIKKAHDKGYRVFGVRLDPISKQTAVERKDRDKNKENSKSDWGEVYERLSIAMEEPVRDLEGFDKLFFGKGELLSYLSNHK